MGRSASVNGSVPNVRRPRLHTLQNCGRNRECCSLPKPSSASSGQRSRAKHSQTRQPVPRSVWPGDSSRPCRGRERSRAQHSSRPLSESHCSVSPDQCPEPRMPVLSSLGWSGAVVRGCDEHAEASASARTASRARAFILLPPLGNGARCLRAGSKIAGGRLPAYVGSRGSDRLLPDERGFKHDSGRAAVPDVGDGRSAEGSRRD